MEGSLRSSNDQPDFDRDMRETVAASTYHIKNWLINKMGQTDSQAPVDAEADELIAMLDDFKKNPAVFTELEGLIDAQGSRKTIFGSLHSAQSEIVDDPGFTERHPKVTDRMGKAEQRINGIIAQWPIRDSKGNRIRPEEYRGWLLNQNAA